VTVITLRKRLERIEASRHQGAPDCIFSDRPLEKGEVPGLLANWRELVASGQASVTGNVLYIISPRLTTKEWAAKVAPLHC
jgi:hypothetical protein